MSDRVEFTCNGSPVSVDAPAREPLLTTLRERLGITSVKDGCAPQGQCGCCTVWVDGQPRVACVTPLSRVAGRAVTTVEGLDPTVRDALGAAFLRTGGSQCGFCTPGIVMRIAAARRDGKTRRADLDRALAAHLCRCTGWLSILDAGAGVGADDEGAGSDRDLVAAARRAELEGGDPQRVDASVPLGGFPFADDDAPPDAWVALPRAANAAGPGIEAAGIEWVVAPTLTEARAAAGKVQGRRTTKPPEAPLPVPPVPEGGAVVVTGWVEPAYLEPDASWCVPGGVPASPLANGGAFGGKRHSPVAEAARELAAHLERPVRTLFSREDVVDRGPKRPPIAATARFVEGRVEIDGVVVGAAACATLARYETSLAYGVDTPSRWESVTVTGPPVSTEFRAFGLAEHTLLVESALRAAGVARRDLVTDERLVRVMLDTAVLHPDGAAAGARVERGAGGIEQIVVRVAAGDPLDAVVLRSYAIGAAHMALGWMTSERLVVDPETGDVLDRTIRSFGVVRAKDTPPIEVTIVDDPGPARPRASDAVFAAVAAAVHASASLTEA